MLSSSSSSSDAAAGVSIAFFCIFLFAIMTVILTIRWGRRRQRQRKAAIERVVAAELKKYGMTMLRHYRGDNTARMINAGAKNLLAGDAAGAVGAVAVPLIISMESWKGEEVVEVVDSGGRKHQLSVVATCPYDVPADYDSQVKLKWRQDLKRIAAAARRKEPLDNQLEKLAREAGKNRQPPRTQ